MRSLYGSALRLVFAAAAFSAAPTYAAWASEAARKSIPADPLQIVISLNQQTLALYRGETLVQTSRVSTGRRGYRTPRGIYSILGKRRRHYSNLYRRAPMPYMQRLTWSGIALHQGYVPHRPASHGCIRLPKGFARSLFRMTDIGGGVIITREPQTPSFIAHPKLFNQRGPEAAIGSAAADAQIAEAALLAASSAAIAPAHFMAVAARAGAPAAAETDISAEAEAGAGASAQASDAAAGGAAAKEADVSAPEESADPVRVLILATANEVPVKPAQTMLTTLGYDVGEIDGSFGRQTAKAVRAFQVDKGMSATGMLDDETIDALYQASGSTRPNGRLYVRRGYVDLFETPVEIQNPTARIGTHLYTAMAFEPTRKPGDSVAVRWSTLTVDDAEGVEGSDAYAALERVTIPEAARARIETLMRPGSTVIVSDAGYGWETGQGTDFIIQPR